LQPHPVDAIGPNSHNGHRHGHLLDRAGKSFALKAGAHLRVAEAGDLGVLGKDHRGGHERAGEGTSSDLVCAGHVEKARRSKAGLEDPRGIDRHASDSNPAQPPRGLALGQIVPRSLGGQMITKALPTILSSSMGPRKRES
jgi:hypothetical protein